MKTKAQRMRLIGLIEIIVESKMPKMIVAKTVGGKRRMPMVRWKTGVIEDMDMNYYSSSSMNFMMMNLQISRYSSFFITISWI